MARRLFQRLVCDERPTAGGGSQSSPSRSTSESHRATASVDARSICVSVFRRHGHPLARLLLWFSQRLARRRARGRTGCTIRALLVRVDRAGRCRGLPTPLSVSMRSHRRASPSRSIGTTRRSRRTRTAGRSRRDRCGQRPSSRAHCRARSGRHRGDALSTLPTRVGVGASRREVVERGERPASGFVGTSATRASHLPLLES